MYRLCSVSPGIRQVLSRLPGLRCSPPVQRREFDHPGDVTSLHERAAFRRHIQGRWPHTVSFGIRAHLL